jgi:hypothetical protein
LSQEHAKDGLMSFVTSVLFPFVGFTRSLGLFVILAWFLTLRSL